MTELRFRDAVASDLPALVAMLADDMLGAARDDASLPLDPGYLAAFEAIADNPSQFLIVAELDGRLVGTLQIALLPGLSRKGACRGLLEGVRIVGDLRGQGLGEALVRWAVEECRARGCASVQLTSDARRADAHRFYERIGFKQSHRGYKLTIG